MQRYPKSSIYDDHFAFDIETARWGFWKWIGATIFSITLFLPMLGTLTELVRERQYRMKDLLDISGLMNASYWLSYLLVIFVSNQLTM